MVCHPRVVAACSDKKVLKIFLLFTARYSCQQKQQASVLFRQSRRIYETIMLFFIYTFLYARVFEQNSLYDNSSISPLGLVV